MILPPCYIIFIIYGMPAIARPAVQIVQRPAIGYLHFEFEPHINLLKTLPTESFVS